MSAEIVRLSDAQLDALADRIAARLAASTADGVLVDAATLARRLGLSRAYVYEHADELGAIRSSKRGRLRFDVAAARAALTPPAEPSGGTSTPRPRRRQSQAGSILRVRG